MLVLCRGTTVYLVLWCQHCSPATIHHPTAATHCISTTLSPTTNSHLPTLSVISTTRSHLRTRSTWPTMAKCHPPTHTWMWTTATLSIALPHHLPLPHTTLPTCHQSPPQTMSPGDPAKPGMLLFVTSIMLEWFTYAICLIQIVVKGLWYIHCNDHFWYIIHTEDAWMLANTMCLLYRGMQYKWIWFQGSA